MIAQGRGTGTTINKSWGRLPATFFQEFVGLQRIANPGD